MGYFAEGKWIVSGQKIDKKGRFTREPTRFRSWIEDSPDVRFRPEPGRYHLYVSLACPWAHRTLIVRALRGLESAVSFTVVDPLMADGGWAFSENPGCGQDTVNNARFLREIYKKARDDYSGRVTVPVLWDRETSTIVNNESRDIVRMFDTAFSGLGTAGVDLYPEGLRERIDQAIEAIYEPVNNGVYRAGFAKTQAAYDEAVNELFAELERLDELLGEQRYLCGTELTEADIFLFTTLFRFDSVYHTHFKCNRKRITDYPNLWAFTREIYQLPGVAETCSLDHIVRHYYWSHEAINPRRIVATGPQLDFNAPHDRDSLPGGPPAVLRN